MSEWRSEPSLFWWNSVASLANNDISRFVAAIPIVGYFILFNDGFAEAFSFNIIAGYDVSDNSPFFLNTATKLRFAFFGSIFVLVSNIVFRFRGPKVLTNSDNDIEFCQLVFNSYSRSEIVDIEEQVTSEKWTLRSPLLLTEHRNYMLTADQTKKPKLGGYIDKQYMISKRPEYLKLIAREWWLGQMHSNPFSRYFTLAFALLGYLMLSISTLDILQAVIRDILA